MELRHLRYFIAVAEALSFSRAATRLRLSQPSLSTQIRDLETELHVKLLERDRSNVSLTDAGAVFLKEARSVLARADKAVARAREAAAGITGEIRIAAVEPLMIQLLPCALSRMHAAVPTAKVHVLERAPSEQLPLLQAGKIHVGFIPLHFARLSAAKGLARESIIRCPLCLMVPASHPLAKKKAVRLQDFAEETFLYMMLFGSDAHRTWTEQNCVKAGFVARMGVAATTVDNLVSLISAGAGVALIAKIAERPKSPGWVSLAVQDEDLEYELLMMHNEKFPSDLRDRFLEIMRDTAASLGPEFSPLAKGEPPVKGPTRNGNDKLERKPAERPAHSKERRLQSALSRASDTRKNGR